MQDLLADLSEENEACKRNAFTEDKFKFMNSLILLPALNLESTAGCDEICSFYYLWFQLFSYQHELGTSPLWLL